LKSVFPDKLLDAQFYYVTIMQDVVSRYHLAVVYATAPDADHLELFKKILVNLFRKLGHGPPLPQHERLAKIGLLARRFRVNADDV
jgi:hypothetical protein